MPLGLALGDVARLVREARQERPTSDPLLVVGPLAEHLARSLASGGDPTAVRTSGDPTRASAVVCVLPGAPRDGQVEVLRAATRAAVPLVGVQTGDPPTRVPYILAEDIVDCRPGHGFPVEEIAAALARVLGEQASDLAARLPVLQPATQRRVVTATAIHAAGTAAAPWIRHAHLPLLVLLQVRMLQDVGVATARAAPASLQALGLTLGPELAGALATGIAGRAVSRSVPWTGAAGRAAIAAGGTVLLGGVATMFGDRLARLAKPS